MTFMPIHITYKVNFKNQVFTKNNKITNLLDLSIGAYWNRVSATQAGFELESLKDIR